jgi:hypothetical protein
LTPKFFCGSSENSEMLRSGFWSQSAESRLLESDLAELCEELFGLIEERDGAGAEPGLAFELALDGESGCFFPFEIL